MINFTNSTSYKSHLVLFPTVKTAASASSMQNAEVQFDGVVPEPATAGLALLSLGALVVRRRR
ncbi:MAG: PEP-CTERM sorting domain-containing protein [Verrucomicrobiales bacterium]